MDNLENMIAAAIMRDIQKYVKGFEAEGRGEPVIVGNLTNGFIKRQDGSVTFLPYDPMRQFRTNEEIGNEIRQLVPDIDKDFKHD